jgi:hypothetical protein
MKKQNMNGTQIMPVIVDIMQSLDISREWESKV